jgi:hypothetical protein
MLDLDESSTLCSYKSVIALNEKMEAKIPYLAHAWLQNWLAPLSFTSDSYHSCLKCNALPGVSFVLGILRLLHLKLSTKLFNIGQVFQSSLSSFGAEQSPLCHQNGKMAS